MGQTSATAALVNYLHQTFCGNPYKLVSLLITHAKFNLSQKYGNWHVVSLTKIGLIELVTSVHTFAVAESTANVSLQKVQVILSRDIKQFVKVRAVHTLPV